VRVATYALIHALAALWLCGALLAVPASTALGSSALASAAAASTVPASNAQAPNRGVPEDELPEGPGKRLLQAACAYCHDLGEITKFRGYYSRAQWRDVVVTMVEYGAPLSNDEVEVLSDYLTAHLGRAK
jgi:cytochrome c5